MRQPLRLWGACRSGGVRADARTPGHILLWPVSHVYRGRPRGLARRVSNRPASHSNFSLAQGLYGLVASWTGRWPRKAPNCPSALGRLSPRDPRGGLQRCGRLVRNTSNCDYTEAIRFVARGIRQRNDFPGAYRVSTAAAAMA